MPLSVVTRPSHCSKEVAQGMQSPTSEAGPQLKLTKPSVVSPTAADSGKSTPTFSRSSSSKSLGSKISPPFMVGHRDMDGSKGGATEHTRAYKGTRQFTAQLNKQQH